ncbi:hypothetical protein KAW80_04505 [Candidatus Babeliales bacterium]|nr:hypothetical protein [Candidatus Babeliales bacterium]
MNKKYLITFSLLVLMGSTKQVSPGIWDWVKKRAKEVEDTTSKVAEEARKTAERAREEARKAAERAREEARKAAQRAKEEAEKLAKKAEEEAKKAAEKAKGFVEENLDRIPCTQPHYDLVKNYRNLIDSKNEEFKTLADSSLEKLSSSQSKLDNAKSKLLEAKNLMTQNKQNISATKKTTKNFKETIKILPPTSDKNDLLSTSNKIEQLLTNLEDISSDGLNIIETVANKDIPKIKEDLKPLDSNIKASKEKIDKKAKQAIEILSGWKRTQKTLCPWLK